MFRKIRFLLYLLLLSLCQFPALQGEVESFESVPAGAFGSIEIKQGTLSTSSGHAVIQKGYARSGAQSFRLLGGENHSAVLELKDRLAQGGELVFWSERWTRAAPFEFEVEARANRSWKSVYSGDKTIAVGGYNTEVRILLPEGTDAVRFTSTTPEGKGVLIDDLDVQPATPMRVLGVRMEQPVLPVMVRLEHNPVVALVVEADGLLDARTLRGIRLSTDGTTSLNDVESIRVFYSGAEAEMRTDVQFDSEKSPAEELVFVDEQELRSGLNYFWVSFEMKEGADIDGRVDASVIEVAFDGGKVAKVPQPSEELTQRIGVCVAKNGDGGSKFFRIPGLARTNKGSLIGVYDNRYRHGGDLPADIDVGMSRSTDGGQTWEPNKVIMDMGDDPKLRYDGIGDPAVLVDRSNNRVWVAALWSRGNNGWNGSGPGLKPEETGQFVLVYSDDDGVTWSDPINITEQVKKPEWRLFFNGPGNGITTSDGTLVFPAQYRDASGMPWSTLIYSKDNGRTWQAGKGVKSNTTEAQLVELSDGSIMINCRDNRGGSRTIGVTRDLGQTWVLHPTDRKALNEPVCMASLISAEYEGKKLLFFSNPNTPREGKPRGRYDMTIKVSTDDGMTWPQSMHTLYDSRNSAGYSCLTQVDEAHVGVLYEGVGLQLFYLRIPISELLR